MEATDKRKREILVGCAAEIDRYRIINLKMKAIFYTLNMFNYDTTNRVLVAEGWCETKMLPKVREALIKGQVLLKLRNKQEITSESFSSR